MEATTVKKKRKPNTIHTHSSESGAIIASIDDLLTEILLRLPVKSLLRFKSVSKQWLSLISNPNFCLRRRNSAPDAAAGVFLRVERVLRRFRYEYIPLHPKKENQNLEAKSVKFELTEKPSSNLVLNSCNGLLLCTNSLTWTYENPKFAFWVYNPTTKLFATVPECKIGYETFVYGITLVFDPVQSPYFKVVFLSFMDNSDMDTDDDMDVGFYRIHVYSSESGVWSIGGGIGAEMLRHPLEYGVYWNGSVHWFTRFRNVAHALRFSVDTHMVDTMPSPPAKDGIGLRRNLYFGVSCNHLHYNEPGFDMHLKVYEMKKDYSEWFVKYDVDLSPIIAAYPEIIMAQCYPPIYVLSLVRDEKDEDSTLILRIPKKVIKFNLVEGTFEKLCELKRESRMGPGGGSGALSELEDEKEFDYIPSVCRV